MNCGGYPYCVSAYEIVGEVVRQLMAIGVPAGQIYLYERFQNQLDEVNYAPHLPDGVQIVAAERANRNVDNSGYDPATYLEANFFGEEDTRSNMMRLVTQRLTKIINIPNMKDHGATGVTGCLKNIAYGSFSNVARTHQRGVSHTYSVVGTLAAIEPLRSRTVLQIMDGLRGVWHGGPFARTTRYVFYPAADHVRDRSGRNRSPAAGHHRHETEGRRGDFDLGPLGELAEDRRHSRARCRSEREHHHSGTRPRGVRLEPRTGRVRSVEDQRGGREGMRWALVAVALLPSTLGIQGSTDRHPSVCVYWTMGPESRPRLDAAGLKNICVPREQVDAWRSGGFDAQGIDPAELTTRTSLETPGIAARAGVASPTRAPWIVANGWRLFAIHPASMPMTWPRARPRLRRLRPPPTASTPF